MLSTPTYCVASDVTGRLNFEGAVVEAAPSTSPSFTAVFVVPAATVQFPSLTANLVTVPSSIVISALLAPFETVTGTFVAYASTLDTVIFGATAIVMFSCAS